MLEWIYIFLFGVGLIYAIFAGIFSGIFGGVLHHGDGPDLGGHDMDVGGHDVDAGGHDVHGGDAGGDVHFSPLSPPVISMFAMSFGGAGLLGLKWFHWENPAAHLGLATVTGLVVGAATFMAFYQLFKHTQTSSAPSESQLIGATAEVIVPIPAQGMGEIAFEAMGRRFNGPAKTQDGHPVRQGSRVVIDKQDATVYVVHEELKA